MEPSFGYTVRPPCLPHHHHHHHHHHQLCCVHNHHHHHQLCSVHNQHHHHQLCSVHNHHHHNCHFGCSRFVPLPLPDRDHSGSYPSQTDLNLQANVVFQEDDDDDPVFVLTDEWRDFFAKSEAKRKSEK